MGLLDRLHKVATGFGGAIQAPFGLVKDLAVAPFSDDDVDGFFNTLYRRGVSRGGQLFGNLFGPSEGVGAAVGGVPAGVRGPIGSVVSPVLEGFETAYREGISEPLSTAFTAASLADAPGGGGIGGLLRGDNWRKAYRIAQHRSPGQAFAFAVLTENVEDEGEVARVAGSDSFEVMSGVADAVFRWRLDPTIVAGTAAGAARRQVVQRPLLSTRDVELGLGSRRFREFKEAVQGLSAAEIRHRFFPDHAAGEAVADVLSKAQGDEFDLALRSFMGHAPSRRVLEQQNAVLAGSVARLTDSKRTLAAANGTLFEDPARLDLLTRELDSLYPLAQRVDRALAHAGALGEVPRVSIPGRVRGAITTSSYYQESKFAAPLRQAFNMRPHRFVNLDEPMGDVQLHRFLQKARVETPRHDDLRSRYIAATTPQERMAILNEGEQVAVNAIAARAGMSREQVNQILEAADAERGKALQMLRSKVYDGEGRSRVQVPGDDGIMVEYPLMVSQDANIMPLVDLDELQKIVNRYGKFWRGKGQLPVDAMDQFMRLWKPSVLLRIGWPLRVVGDEQLRIMAKIGLLAHLKNLRESGLPTRAVQHLRRLPDEERRGAGSGGFSHRGYELEGAYGTPGDQANVYEAAVSGRASMDKFLGRSDSKIIRDLFKNSGEWKSVAPDNASWGRAWAHAVNRQIRSDEMARKFLQGESVDNVTRWLTGTPEGAQYLRRLPLRAENPHRWAAVVKEHVDSYTFGDPEIMAAAARGRATLKMVERVAPDAASRPTVHGEILASALGTSATVRAWNKLIESGYRAMGGLPSDVLSRQPYFDAVYQAETRRLLDLLDDGAPLGQRTLDSIQARAREKGLVETRKLLYDLAEESDLSHTLRFFMPFYSAWQEVLTRWAGLAVENPAFIARGRQIWQAPDKAGLVQTDDQGNDWVTLSLPEWAKDFPGLRGMGAVKFTKESLSLAVQGTPGFGPLVQIPVNEIVKDRPDLLDAVKFVLPYGSTQELQNLVLPATLKRFATRAAGDEDRVFRNALLRIYFDKMVDYNLGKRAEAPTYQEALRDAKAHYNLRMVASFVSPAALAFNSPYQPYIDAYRALVETDPETAAETFLDQYGEEYFALTQSLSRSMDGVPPTLEGWASRQKYRDLIEQNPELGALIVGAEGAGEFNRAVYDGQLANRLRPGSPHKQRESPSFEEQAVAPDVRLGWIKYGQLMDLIESYRVERGLPNLQVKEARDLAAARAAIVAELADEHPDWHKAFLSSGKAMPGRIAAMRTIVEDDRLAARDDMRGLREYLELRDAVAAELGRREFKTLQAGANRDLAFAFESLVGELVESNLAFGQLYYRWLEHDRVEAA